VIAARHGTRSRARRTVLHRPRSARRWSVVACGPASRISTHASGDDAWRAPAVTCSGRRRHPVCQGSSAICRRPHSARCRARSAIAERRKAPRVRRPSRRHRRSRPRSRRRRLDRRGRLIELIQDPPSIEVPPLRDRAEASRPVRARDQSTTPPDRADKPTVSARATPARGITREGKRKRRAQVDPRAWSSASRAKSRGGESTRCCRSSRPRAPRRSGVREMVKSKLRRAARTHRRYPVTTFTRRWLARVERHGSTSCAPTPAATSSRTASISGSSQDTLRQEVPTRHPPDQEASGPRRPRWTSD